MRERRNGGQAPDAAGPGEVPGEGRRGLVMVSDPDLLDTVLRTAAAAGCEVVRALDVTEARRSWPGAPVVVLDPAAARECTARGVPRRPGVVVAVSGEPPPEVWKDAVAVGAEHVISLPEAEPWLVAALARAAEGGGGDGAVLAVVGGRGGAGASVFAVATAVRAASGGERALLVDCDPLGGGVDLVLGAEDLDGLRWPQVGTGAGRVPASALHAALPAPELDGAGGLAVLSCDRSPYGPSPAAVASVLDAGRRAGDTVVCDVPRYPTEAAVAALAAADLTVVVVPADVRSCAAAARVIDVVAEHGGPSAGLVVRGPAPGGLTPGEIATALGLPLVASMRAERGLARLLEQGSAPSRARGPLASAATAVLDALRSAAAGRSS
jgi:secretion/DNA translocation related CpaE-like protein